MFDLFVDDTHFAHIPYEMVSLLDDTRFRVGFEFEFIVMGLTPDFYPEQYSYRKVCSLNYTQLWSSFYFTKKQKVQIESLINQKIWHHWPKKRLGFYSTEDNHRILSASYAIALFKLRPRYGWYSHRWSQFENVDVTNKVNAMLDNLDTSDPQAVRSTVRSLSRYFVLVPDIVDEKYKTKEKIRDNLRGEIADHLSGKFGFDIPYVSREEDDNRQLTKTQPDWYLRTESLWYGEPFDDLAIELELNTPIFRPREALDWCEYVLGVLKDRDYPFKIKTNTDCGLHINISRPDIKLQNISPLSLLLFDQKESARPFGRIRHMVHHDIEAEIRDTVKRLIKYEVLSPKILNSEMGIYDLIDAINSNADYASCDGINFYNIQNYGYVEYRLAGGKNYPSRFPLIRRHLLECLNMHNELLKDPYRNPQIRYKIKSIVEEEFAKKRKRIRHESAA